MGERARGSSWSRRQVLTAIGAGSAVAGGAGVALALRGSGAGPQQFSSEPALRLAMHTHGSWSEGWGSWEGHFGEAAAAGMDVLFMTDHEDQAQAVRFLTSLAGAAWESEVSGAVARKVLAATPTGELRLLVESADARAASGTLRIQPQPCAKDRLRTSISGLRLDHTFGPSRLEREARYEVRVDLSQHPEGSAGERPAGRYALIYRFGTSGRSRFLQGGGLVGVVAAPLPPAGTTVRLSPEADVAALWPTMWAPDNSIYGLSFTVTSPRAGSSADVTVTSVAMPRERNSPSDVTADQHEIIARYGPRHPGLAARLSTEIGRYKMHMNPFGVPQFFPDFALDSPSDHDAFFTDLVADVHAAGGVMSLNHPFGYDAEPLLPVEQQVERRRSTYRSLAAQAVYGVDVLEVGYAVRGNVDIGTHLGLWDTFSRNGFFLTGNGANDDHSGEGWAALRNGFFTGAWAASTSDADLVSALRAGRAFFAHLGAWKAASLDLRLDGAAPMGSVLVSTDSSHTLQIASSALPAGATVELIQGPVDVSGAPDPQTDVARVLTASDFTSGVAATTISTPSSGFWRVQVRSSAGAIIAGTNPVWVLHSAPPGGVPTARRV